MRRDQVRAIARALILLQKSSMDVRLIGMKVAVRRGIASRGFNLNGAMRNSEPLYDGSGLLKDALFVDNG